MKALLLVIIILVVFVFLRRGEAQPAPAPGSVYDFKVKTMQGSEQSLGDYKGQVLLIVNTASHCGFTPQYAGLEKLYERYKDKGFTVLAFPANDFLGQEPGDDATIKQFCELKYKTTFPLFSKIHVRGAEMAPLYQYLTTGAGFNGSITWNFNKFLVDREGRVVARFGSKTDPLDPQIEKDVLAALAQS